MLQFKDFFRLLLFSICIFQVQSLQDACPSKQSRPIIDISSSKILKTAVYQYKIETFDNPVVITKNYEGQFLFEGNFSRMILINKALKKQYVYIGKQIIFRVPSMHQHAKNKSAQAQLQVVHYLEGVHEQHRHKIITMTQLYLVTKFLSKIDMNLCKQIDQKKTNGSIFKTSKLMKIIQKTPVLMYQGSKDFYPCRNDLLCMVRKQFALISQQDLECLKQKMNFGIDKQIKLKRYKQKNLFEVAQMVQNDVNNDL